jgi:hypothetical protein
MNFEVEGTPYPRGGGRLMPHLTHLPKGASLGHDSDSTHRIMPDGMDPGATASMQRELAQCVERSNDNPMNMGFP